MKERGILMSAPMVMAHLEDRKTETRRLSGLEEINKQPDRFHLTKDNYIDKQGRFNHKLWQGIQGFIRIVYCPYGQPGDLLYIRETWMDHRIFHLVDDQIKYKADASQQFIEEWQGWWKPSIHMPKEAARIWLKLKEVKLERLHDITEEGAIAEGIQPATDHLQGLYRDYGGDKTYSYGKIALQRTSWMAPIHSYQSLWESVKVNDSWENNPWVWVLKYEVISKTGRPSQS